MDNFKFEIIPHKDGYSWVQIYRIPELNAPNRIGVGTSFYLTDNEILELQNKMNMKVWEYYRKIVERHPESNEEIVESKDSSIVTYKVGQLFEVGLSDWLCEKHEYILAQIGPSEIMLIDIKNGKRWSSGIKVNDIYAVTEDEMNKLVADGCTFKLVK